MNVEKINWEAFKKDLEASIANEKIWAMGSLDDEFEMHRTNIERMEEQIKDIENGDYDSILRAYDESVFNEFVEEGKEVKIWDVIYDIKKGLVVKIKEMIGERTIDVSNDNINVSAVEHHSGEGLHGQLVRLTEAGFVLQWDALELPWNDMVVEDLAMVHDYLLTGKW